MTLDPDQVRIELEDRAGTFIGDFDEDKSQVKPTTFKVVATELDYLAL